MNCPDACAVSYFAAARRKPTSASLIVGLGFLLIATVGTLVVLYRKHASASSRKEQEQEYVEHQSPYGSRSPCREGRQFIVSFPLIVPPVE